MVNVSDIISELKEVHRFRYVVYASVQTNLKLRYRRSYLGFLWTVLAPTLNYLVIGLVFSLMVGSRRSDYFAYYFSGALFFSLIAGILGKAPAVFIGNEHFIKKIYLPKLIFVLNAMSIEFVNFLLSGTALVVLGLITGKFKLSIYVPLSVIPVFLIAAALLGLACVIGVLTVYFRDFVHIIPVGIQALFFMTPIIYDHSMIPTDFHWLIDLNPVSYYLQLFRDPLIGGHLPSAEAFIFCSLLSTACLIFGLAVVKHFDNRIIFKL